MRPTSHLFVIVLFTLGGMAHQAQADVACRFEGHFGKKEVECKAQLNGTCNTLGDKIIGKETSSQLTTCHGFVVWCNGRKITEGEESCNGLNVQGDVAGRLLAQFQFTDRSGEYCVYPAVKFEVAVPTERDRVGARLYLSERKVLFGTCKVGEISGP